jgi:hypothetical protein
MVLSGKHVIPICYGIFIEQTGSAIATPRLNLLHIKGYRLKMAFPLEEEQR